jgi:hypothetical protein
MRVRFIQHLLDQIDSLEIANTRLRNIATHEAQENKLQANQTIPRLINKFKLGPPKNTAYVWYWWHFFGRAEVFLHDTTFRGIAF